MKFIILKISKGLILICVLIFHHHALSQYLFTFKAEPFVFLDSSATNVTENHVWKDVDSMFYIPIGFDLNINGETFDSLRFNPHACIIDFFQKCNIQYQDSLSGPNIFAFYAGLIDRGVFYGSSNEPYSPISYVMEGAPPNRVFKLEWKNAGFDIGNYTDYLSFQVWFFEGTDIIDIRFGPHYIQDTAIVWLHHPDGPIIFFSYDFNCYPNNIAEKTIWLFGNRNSPGFSLIDSINQTPAGETITGAPDNGIVLRFNPLKNEVPERIKLLPLVFFYPNPFSEHTSLFMSNFDCNDCTLLLYNLFGKVERNISIQDDQTIIFRNELKSGFYMYRIEDKEHIVASGKLLILEN